MQDRHFIPNIQLHLMFLHLFIIYICWSMFSDHHVNLFIVPALRLQATLGDYLEYLGLGGVLHFV